MWRLADNMVAKPARHVMWFECTNPGTLECFAGQVIAVLLLPIQLLIGLFGYALEYEIVPR